MKASTGGNSDYPILEDDAYLARIYSIVDIGIQETNFGDKHQILVTWELPTEIGEDERPYAISKFYTLSLASKANLCKDIESMTKAIPEEKKSTFDFQKLIGLTSQLTIATYTSGTGFERNKIAAVTKPMKGTKVPKAINDPVFFDLENPDWAIYDALPDWIKERCNKDSIKSANSSPAGTAQEPELPDADNEDDDEVDW